MGKTFRRNDRWKKDRRDKAFQKSKKFKEIKHGGHHHSHKPIVGDPPPIEEIENYDDINNS